MEAIGKHVSVCLLALIAAVPACEPTRSSVPNQPSASAAVSASPLALAARVIRTHDDLHADLVAEIPGFGGMYYDEASVLNVNLQQPGLIDLVRPALAKHLSRGPRRSQAWLAKVTRDA